MRNKRFVGLDICPYCRRPKRVLIQEYMKDLPREVCTSPEPCNDCKEQFKAEGKVPMYEASIDMEGEINFTGRFIWIKREAINGEEFIKMMEDKGFLICDEETFNNLTKGANYGN